MPSGQPEGFAAPFPWFAKTFGWVHEDPRRFGCMRPFKLVGKSGARSAVLLGAGSQAGFP
jgi:hypothetical protein